MYAASRGSSWQHPGARAKKLENWHVEIPQNLLKTNFQIDFSTLKIGPGDSGRRLSRFGDALSYGANRLSLSCLVPELWPKN